NSQHHLHLLIKALDSKIENLTIDLVVPPKDDDRIVCTIKPNDAYDKVKVDNFEDDYMLMMNDEEKLVKLSLNDTEIEPKPDKIAVKQGILEQQPNAAKGKTTVLEETVGVKVKEKPILGRDLDLLKVKKKNCQHDLRPNYVLRPPEADWAIVSAHFSTCILSGSTPGYFSNGHINHGVKLAGHKIFDDKEACTYEIGLKCINKGYECKVVRSCTKRDVTRVYRPKDIINDLNIDVSYKRAWKGKQLALESNQGCPIASSAQLPYYCYNSKLVNENTITHIDTDNEGRFKILFIGAGVMSGTNIQNKLTYTYSNTKCQA
nr:transposase, MuDR, MULE transposase domain protein [Tanacetum cinerariifolium]